MKSLDDIGVALVCPQCRSGVIHIPDAFVCSSRSCRLSYPIVDEIPRFLVDDARSLTLEEWSAVVNRRNGQSSSR